ncbi:response regulator [Caldicellulosiruptor danielii]|uniref:Response regulator n=1 Tax=Anaerocellum danielii TaxID=1387557 RepID=A0ABZ0U526_9FIRM|nr:response regulator [Caldicellulosiruptor danielii]WPX09405.1 response regulator [Caldicellulosiruptor danielii]
MSDKNVKVLVIEDEVQIRNLLRMALSGYGYVVKEAANGEERLNFALTFKPDIIILDLGLPDANGIEVIKKLREWSSTPIIVLSVREQENDKIMALDSGADDYVTKPFGMRELLARIRTALRHRTMVTPQTSIELDDLKIDLATRKIMVGEKEVKLTPTEYEILKILALNAGKVVYHKQLLKEVWGPMYENEVHYLRIYIAQIRKKIEADPSRPRHLITEPGVGYRLI